MNNNYKLQLELFNPFYYQNPVFIEVFDRFVFLQDFSCDTLTFSFPSEIP